MECAWEGQTYNTPPPKDKKGISHPETPSETEWGISEPKTPSPVRKVTGMRKAVGELGKMLSKPFARNHEGTPVKPTEPAEPAGVHGQRITILSIDGGGVRGVILATILQQLEACLQKLDGSNKRIVDYFDLIAGTSTGGLISAMLATPSPEKPTRPMFTAAEITDFYKKYASQIQGSGPVGNNQKTLRALPGSTYDPQGLKGLLNEYFPGDKYLSDMLTHVIIPSYDIGVEKPVFFSSMRAEENALENPPLNLVCQATLATPTYFPPVQFRLRDKSKASVQEMEFNMIDGVVVVNNPTYVAITQAIKDVRSQRMYSDRVNYKGYRDLLVLSLGTRNRVQNLSTDKNQEMALVDMVFNASSDMVDYNLNIMFKSQKSSQNYLRITTNSLKGSEVLLDDSSLTNLDRLVKVGTQLLEDPVTKRDIETGELVLASNDKTNHKALERFAKFLSQERLARPERLMTKKTRKIPTVMLPLALANSKLESKSEPDTTKLAKVASPTHNSKTAVEKVMESQVKVQELAYVTFPYHLPQQFLDNPFQTSTHNLGSSSSVDASFIDPIYIGRSNLPESSKSLENWQGDQSTTTFSDYPFDNCKSNQDSYTYYESAYQMLYPKTQSSNLSSQLDQGRYQDYFNIFS